MLILCSLQLHYRIPKISYKSFEDPVGFCLKEFNLDYVYVQYYDVEYNVRPIQY